MAKQFLRAKGSDCQNARSLLQGPAHERLSRFSSRPRMARAPREKRGGAA